MSRRSPAAALLERPWACGLAAASLLAACYDGGAPLSGWVRRNEADHGPAIVWDVHARPLPEIPFPNDVGTRPDPSSPTGRRVNVSTEAPTEHERRLRRHLDELDGFGTFSPLWLRFDGRIDVEDLWRRQNDSDPSNDGVLLLDVTEGSPGYGQAVALDTGSGPPDFAASRFPVTLENNGQYFLHDPRAEGSNLLFESVEEDLDGDGLLGPGEDKDGDGVLDHPNVWGRVLRDDRLGDPYRHLLTFYELETDSLIVRPVTPLRQRTTYAVVVTRAVRGADSGSPVRSPFADVHHLQQTAALEPLFGGGVLAAQGLGPEDVAFTWTFTTQSITSDFEVIRAGLYGRGRLAGLAEDFSDALTDVPVIDDRPGVDNPYILPSEALTVALNDSSISSLLGLPAASVDELAEVTLEHVAYFVFAALDSPSFIRNDQGVFQLDRGTPQVSRETVYLNCSVPRGGGPFPVAMMNHGSGSTRLAMLGFAGPLAKEGLTVCAIDAYGHGLPDRPEVRLVAEQLLARTGLAAVARMAFSGRAVDLNHDGFSDSGGDFWTVDMFHTRDAVRQSVVDTFQAVRVLRAFGSRTMPVDADGDGAEELAGDFDADGVIDFGGPDVPYSLFGFSLGGITAAVTAAVEPAFAAVAPIAAGGGLVDVAGRSSQTGMLEAVFLPVLGSLVVGDPLTEIDSTQLLFDAVDVISERREPFARVPATLDAPAEERLAAGDRLEVVDLDNGESDTIELHTDTLAGFRLTVPTDRGDRLQVRAFHAGAAAPYRVIDSWERVSTALEGRGWQGEEIVRGQALEALQDGYGLRRQTPGLRQLMGVAQMILDPADPVSYAARYREPLDMPPDPPRQAVVLSYTSTGDINVPVHTGVTLDRVAGLLDPQTVDPRWGRTQERVVLDAWTAEGLEKLERFAADPCHHDTRRVLFDLDDAAGALDPLRGPTLTRVAVHPDCQAPSASGAEPPPWCRPCAPQPPLRATVRHPSGQLSGVRFMYLLPTGAHTFVLPDSSLVFDYPRYYGNQLGRYLASGGRELLDDPCLAERDGCP